MTPEERFERIERNLQTYADMLVQSAERLSTIEHLQHQNAEQIGKLETHMAELETHMAKLTDTMNRLGNIVISHELRLESLEGNPPPAE